MIPDIFFDALAYILPGSLHCPIPSFPKCGTARNLPTSVSLRGCFAREGEQSAGMKIMIYAQVEVVLPVFLSRMLSRGQMGDARKPGEKGATVPRPQRSNPKTKHQAIKLRKESTPAERKLWSRIRNDQLGVSFRRQHAVGSYIPDFCSPKARLIIELDGTPLGRSTWSRKSTMKKEKNIWKHEVIRSYAFGTMM